LAGFSPPSYGEILTLFYLPRRGKVTFFWAGKILHKCFKIKPKEDVSILRLLSRPAERRHFCMKYKFCI
jgi:hypothetical protein